MELDQKIEAYLSGELADEELAAFEKSLEEDASLRREVQTYQEIDAFLGAGDWPETSNEKDRTAYAEALQRLRSKGVPDMIDEVLDQPTRPAFPFWRAIAASITIVLVGFAWFYLRPDRTPQELFQAYYDPTELPSFAERGTTTEEEIVQLYKAGAYDQLVDQISSGDDIKMELKLFHGIALLEMDLEEQALQVFAEYVNSTLLDAPQGYWYIGLAYLKQGNTAQALESFEKLQQSNMNFKRGETMALIEALK